MNIVATNKKRATLFLVMLLIGLGLSFIGIGFILISAEFGGIVKAIVFLVGMPSVLAQLKTIILISDSIQLQVELE